MNLRFWNKVMIRIINYDDVAPSTRVYYSMTHGLLQISSTTRNLVSRFKRWSKGKVLVTKF